MESAGRKVRPSKRLRRPVFCALPPGARARRCTRPLECPCISASEIAAIVPASAFAGRSSPRSRRRRALRPGTCLPALCPPHARGRRNHAQRTAAGPPQRRTGSRRTRPERPRHTAPRSGPARPHAGRIRDDTRASAADAKLPARQRKAGRQLYASSNPRRTPRKASAQPGQSTEQIFPFANEAKEKIRQIGPGQPAR